LGLDTATVAVIEITIIVEIVMIVIAAKNGT
jgi:hypothetical protein